MTCRGLLMQHKNGMSVYKAVRLYWVPEQTLLDRNKGLVDLDTTIGFD